MTKQKPKRRAVRVRLKGWCWPFSMMGHHKYMGFTTERLKPEQWAGVRRCTILIEEPRR